jgi:hypothetical protein
VLVVVLAVVYGPSLRYSMMTLESGDQLYLSEDETFLGTVSAYEAQHLFHNGARRAYLLRDAGQSQENWYPAGDLARVARMCVERCPSPGVG